MKSLLTPAMPALPIPLVCMLIGLLGPGEWVGDHMPCMLKCPPAIADMLAACALNWSDINSATFIKETSKISSYKE